MIFCLVYTCDNIDYNRQKVITPKKSAFPVNWNTLSIFLPIVRDESIDFR